MLIAQISDLHVGGARYREDLLRTAIAEINDAGADLVVVAGDLTDDGFPDQYPVAAEELSALWTSARVVRVPGNHDARNVGYVHFEDTFGARDFRHRSACGGLELALVAVDSTKPDLDEGEIGREHYGWIEEGFDALETVLADSLATGTYCEGDSPTIADCCLVPQVYNAKRFGVNLDRYPNIARIDADCLKLPAFIDASPERQPDREK